MILGSKPGFEPGSARIRNKSAIRCTQTFSSTYGNHAWTQESQYRRQLSETAVCTYLYSVLNLPHPTVGTKEVLEAPSPSADRQRGESIVTLLSAVNGGL
jgi:hypothetical protein